MFKIMMFSSRLIKTRPIRLNVNTQDSKLFHRRILKLRFRLNFTKRREPV